MIRCYNDTILSVAVDTVYYSHNRQRLFSTIILHTTDSIPWEPDYQAGIKIGPIWKLNRPGGDTWTTGFSSDSELKHDVKHYLFKHFSINGSSNRPEIWDDTYLFSP
jgi:hypothetical protein